MEAACSLAAAEALEQSLDALLGRLRNALPKLAVELGRLLALSDLHPEGEAAGLDYRAQVGEARLLCADLPARDLGSFSAEARRQFGLRQARPQARLPDQLRCAHRIAESTLVLLSTPVPDKLRDLHAARAESAVALRRGRRRCARDPQGS